MESQEQPKKCFCTRCFLPIEPKDMVSIDGQSFHRPCSTCCVCRTIPTSLKMFYGQVFCSECFKNHVLTRFRGETPHIHSNSWWMQWTPGTNTQKTTQNTEQKNEEMIDPQKDSEEEAPKKCVCARCHHLVAEINKVEIAGQSFHAECAQCYFCHNIPTRNLKIYYGQVLCEDCFHRYVLSRSRDNPSEFFRTCFEHWQNNAQFAENIKDFMMEGNKDRHMPFIFMMHGPQPAFCGQGTAPQHWFQPEPKRSSTSATVSIGKESNGTWDLSYENRTETSDLPDSCATIDESANQENFVVAAAEKIVKLTKYLHVKHVNNKKPRTKWENVERSKVPTSTSIEACPKRSYYAWIDLQNQKTYKIRSDCPRCLWQCGPIYLNSDYYLPKEVCHEEN